MVTTKAAVCLETLISVLDFFCLMRVKIVIRNLGIFLLSACDFHENWCQDGRTVLMGPNLNCIHVCTVKRYDKKKSLRKIRYVTHCVSEIFFSFIVKIPLEKTWSDSCAAHPIACTHYHANTQTSSQWFMICYQKIFSVKIKVKVPPPARHGGTDPPILQLTSEWRWLVSFMQ